MTEENDIIEYIYGNILKLRVPLKEYPVSMNAIMAPFIHGTDGATYTAFHIPYERTKLEKLIQRMIQFEKYSKPMSEKSVNNKATHLSRITAPSVDKVQDAVKAITREIDADILERVWMMGGQSYKKLCRNHLRLYELYNFLHNVKDDFIASLRIQWTGIRDLNADVARGRIEFVKKLVEFSVGLEGITLNADLPKYRQEEIADQWMLVCNEQQYFNDFSRLLDSRNFEKHPNAIIFLMDYTAEGYLMGGR